MVNFIQTMGKVAENVAGVEGVAALGAKAAYNAGLNNLNAAAGVMLMQIKLAPQMMVYILPRYDACPGR
ncbi:hypothetical protein ACFL9S_17385 [Erwinia sp. AnSW2-5]|uniref:hypothetical protein n=1 Tax=Erwinia sp. AnSW2-5 TaxID=3367692 RepID=UPI00385AEFC6